MSDVMKNNENVSHYADIVLYNGKIWTASEKVSKDESAVAIKDNIIIYVGNDKKVKKYIAPYTRVINLHKKRVVPGFEDCHAHLLAFPARTFGSIRKYDPQINDYIVSKIITLGKKIFIKPYHIYCKVIRKTPMDILYVGVPIILLPKFLIKRNWRKMMDAIVKMGVTSVTEAGLKTWREFEILQEMYNDGELKVRFNILFASRLLYCAIKKGYKTGYGDEWFRILGIKLYSDGWITTRTAAIKGRYNKRLSRGILFYDFNKAVKVVRDAYEGGFKVIATHAVGDRAIETMLNAYEEVLRNKKDRDHRFTIEHVFLIPRHLRNLMRSLNVIASIQLSFATTDCNWVHKYLGEKKVEDWMIWKTLLEEEDENGRRIKCVGSSDYPMDTVSPFWGIQRIVTRRDIPKDSPEGCNLEEKLTVEQALRLITIDAAYSSYEEDIKGSIEIGKLADLVVLQKDIIEMGKIEEGKEDMDNAYDIHDVNVDMTIIDGKIVYFSNPSNPL